MQKKLNAYHFSLNGFSIDHTHFLGFLLSFRAKYWMLCCNYHHFKSYDVTSQIMLCLLICLRYISMYCIAIKKTSRYAVFANFLQPRNFGCAKMHCPFIINDDYICRWPSSKILHLENFPI